MWAIIGEFGDTKFSTNYFSMFWEDDKHETYIYQSTNTISSKFMHKDVNIQNSKGKVRCKTLRHQITLTSSHK